MYIPTYQFVWRLWYFCCSCEYTLVMQRAVPFLCLPGQPCLNSLYLWDQMIRSYPCSCTHISNSSLTCPMLCPGEQALQRDLLSLMQMLEVTAEPCFIHGSNQPRALLGSLSITPSELR